MNWKEIGTRALLTFIQAFVAVVMVDGIGGWDELADAKPAVVAGVAALLSLIYRVVREYQASKGWDTEA